MRPTISGDQAEIEQVVGERPVEQGGQGPRQADQAERAAGEPGGIERHQLHRDRDAEGGHRQILLAQAQGRKADDQRREAGCGHAADQPDPERQPEAAEHRGALGPDQDRRGIGADRDEADDAGIEQAGEAPLQIEAEHRDAEDQRHDQEEHQIGGDADHRLPPSRPCGLT